MKLGITQTDSFIRCAKCGALISETGEYNQKYCVNCGNPLLLDAIYEYEETIQQIKDDTIKQIADKLSKNPDIKDTVLKLLED